MCMNNFSGDCNLVDDFKNYDNVPTVIRADLIKLGISPFNEDLIPSLEMLRCELELHESLFKELRDNNEQIDLYAYGWISNPDNIGIVLEFNLKDFELYTQIIDGKIYRMIDCKPQEFYSSSASINSVDTCRSFKKYLNSVVNDDSKFTNFFKEYFEYCSTYAQNELKITYENIWNSK